MRTREIAITKPVQSAFNALWLLPLLAASLVFSGGCASRGSAGEENPVAGIAVQSPPAFGVITRVTSAAMAGKENRMGDIILTIDLDDGQVIMVIQSEDDVYVPGDRVRVLRDGKGFVRVHLL